MLATDKGNHQSAFFLFISAIS